MNKHLTAIDFPMKAFFHVSIAFIHQSLSVWPHASVQRRFVRGVILMFPGIDQMQASGIHAIQDVPREMPLMDADFGADGPFRHLFQEGFAGASR